MTVFFVVILSKDSIFEDFNFTFLNLDVQSCALDEIKIRT